MGAARQASSVVRRRSILGIVAPAMETYLTRITWNEHEWRRPSGPIRRREQGTYVAKHGFGHEEWLNRPAWRVGGWCYAFIEGVQRSRDRLEGSTINLRLFAISPSKTRLMVGEIHNAQVLTWDQSASAFKRFRARGWFREMQREITAVGLKAKVLRGMDLNVRFQAADLKLFEPPVAGPAGLMRLNRFRLYQAKGQTLAQWKARAKRAPLLTDKPTSTIGRTTKATRKIDLIENQMENELAALLRDHFGADQVKRQANFVDLSVQQGKRRSIIEIKSPPVARRAIREALGQLLDYAFFEAPEAACELVVVGRGPLLPRDKRYLATLTKRFRLPITYRRYRLGGTFTLSSAG